MLLPSPRAAREEGLVETASRRKWGDPMITTIVLGLVSAIGADVDYSRDVKPILAARCTSCHGSIRQKAGLRLDTAALVRRGGTADRPSSQVRAARAC